MGVRCDDRFITVKRQRPRNGRSAKPWGSFGEAAADLEMVALDSRVSKATRLIMLASFSLMTMTSP